jgi:hypothetical protein
MDDVLASGAAKLATTEQPIAVPRHKFTLLSLREEALKIERALEQGEQVAIRSSLTLPGAWPVWLQRLLHWLHRPFINTRLITRPASEAPLQEKLNAIRKTIDQLAIEHITGILTPLTLADEAECNAHYYKTVRHLEAAMPQEETKEGAQARQEAIDFTAGHYMAAKRVECALKKKEDGRLVRALTTKQAHALDPRITTEIWILYRATFELTEDELGKSQAPRKGSSATSGS